MDEVENVGPVAAIALDDVKFAPQKFFRGNQGNPFPANGELGRVLEPCRIDLRALVCHSPDDVDDNVSFVAAVNPCSIVGKFIIVVGKTGFREGALGASAVFRANIEIYVLGIPPMTRKGSSSEAAAEQKFNSFIAQGANGGTVGLPLAGRNGIRPTKFNTFQRTASGRRMISQVSTPGCEFLVAL